MKSLVTGATGFVGKALVAALRERGDAVRTFARRELPSRDPGIEHHRGDIQDAAAVRAAVAGCDRVFHVAADVGSSGPHARFHATNVLGTQHVLAACRAEGVAELVYTSTPSVVFGRADLEGVDESVPYPRRHLASYPATKAEAERLVSAAHGPELRTVSVRPHIVWGPGDTSLLPRLLARAHRLRRIGDPTKCTDVTFIDDAVAAHLAAADALRSRPEVVGGRAYFVSSGEPIPIWTFVDRVLEAAGYPPVRGHVPRTLALAAGWLAETLHRLRGAPGEPVLSRWTVHALSSSHWFDISAARRDLGYAPQVSIEDGLQRLRAWCDAQRSSSAPEVLNDLRDPDRSRPS